MNATYIIEKVFGTKAAVIYTVICLAIAAAVIGVTYKGWQMGDDPKERKKAESYVSENRSSVTRTSDELMKLVSRAAADAETSEDKAVLSIFVSSSGRTVSFTGPRGSELKVSAKTAERARKLDIGEYAGINTCVASKDRVMFVLDSQEIICEKKDGTWDVYVK